jgi:hypothetical protein
MSAKPISVECRPSFNMTASRFERKALEIGETSRALQVFKRLGVGEAASATWSSIPSTDVMQ